jgi:transcriptional regulator with XRE-family HTH domain
MPPSIGKRIKALRVDQRMTLADLGLKVKLSTSYLSQLERDKTSPSLSTLMDIARVLNVGPRHFFEDEPEVVYIQRASQVPDSIQATPVMRLPLSPATGDKKLEVYRVILEPRASFDQPNSFAGEELGFVLRGELTITFGDEVHVLAAGDSIHYDASQPYHWRNAGDEACVVIWGCAATSLTS